MYGLVGHGLGLVGLVSWFSHGLVRLVMFLVMVLVLSWSSSWSSSVHVVVGHVVVGQCFFLSWFGSWFGLVGLWDQVSTCFWFAICKSDEHTS